MADRQELSEQGDSSKVEVFVAGDVDAKSVKVTTPWGEVGATKIPVEEMDLDPEHTIHADLTDEGSRK